jgi:ADP-ribose pyrophosphatase YjhB (NUDIX family)
MDDSYIDIGVGAIIEDDEGKVLFVRHKKERGGYWQGKWIFPGGMLELGETVGAGIRREVFEETGLSIEIDPDTLPPVERIVREGENVLLHVVYVVKGARLSGGTLIPGDDVGEAMWVERNTVKDFYDQLHPDTRRIWELYNS